MITFIASPDDPRIALYRSVRERDLIRSADAFIVEGKVTLVQLVERSRFAIHSLLLAESRLEDSADLIARLGGAAPVYAAPQAIMNAITGYPIHRGVLAIALRGPETPLGDLLQSKDDAPLLALIGLSNHDNVGACFRNAAALGARAVLMDRETCDPLYRKAIRVSAGAALHLPFARAASGEALVSALQAAGYETWALTPRGGRPLQTLAPPPRLAIVLGAEGPGLPAELMGRCTQITIPMSNGVDSLNVATAGAIALSHVAARRAGSAD